MISYEELDNENDNLNFWNSMIKKCVVWLVKMIFALYLFVLFIFVVNQL